MYLDDVTDPPRFRPLLKLPTSCSLAERYAYFGSQRLVMPARLRIEDLQALLGTTLADRATLLKMAESQWRRVAYYDPQGAAPSTLQELEGVCEMLRSATALSGVPATLHWRWGDGLYMQSAEPPLEFLDDRKLARAFAEFYRTHHGMPQKQGTRPAASPYVEAQLYHWYTEGLMARKGAPLLEGDSCAVRTELQRELASILEEWGVPRDLIPIPQVETTPTMRLVCCVVWALDAPKWAPQEDAHLWRSSQTQQLAPHVAWDTWGDERKVEELAILHFAQKRLPPASPRYVGVDEMDTWREHWRALPTEDRAYYHYRRLTSCSLDECSHLGFHHVIYRLLREQVPLQASVRRDLEAYVRGWEQIATFSDSSVIARTVQEIRGAAVVDEPIKK